MTKTEAKKLFPITVNVTKGIIEKGSIDLYNTKKCIGALCLKKALGVNAKDLNPLWGCSIGHIHTDRECLYITTREAIDMMDIENPITVTFIIINKNCRL